MLEVIFLVALIVLVCVVISTMRRSRDLTDLHIEQAKKQGGASQPPPPMLPKEDKYDRLIKLKKLLDEGVLTKEEFDREREKILGG
jgi:hypothetical protein